MVLGYSGSRMELEDGWEGCHVLWAYINKQGSTQLPQSPSHFSVVVSLMRVGGLVAEIVPWVCMVDS